MDCWYARLFRRFDNFEIKKPLCIHTIRRYNGICVTTLCRLCPNKETRCTSQISYRGKKASLKHHYIAMSGSRSKRLLNSGYIFFSFWYHFQVGWRSNRFRFVTAQNPALSPTKWSNRYGSMVGPYSSTHSLTIFLTKLTTFSKFATVSPSRPSFQRTRNTRLSSKKHKFALFLTFLPHFGK